MRPPPVSVKTTDRVVVEAKMLLPTQTTTLRTVSTRLNSTVYENQIVDVTGTMSEILNLQGIHVAYSVHAKPSDVRGCTAEYVSGRGWIGCLGQFLTDADFNNSITSTTNVGTGAWVLVGNSGTGVSMRILQ